MNITEIAFTVYPVTDLARSRAFYEKTLGLTPAREFLEEGGSFVEYDIASGTFAIGEAREGFTPTPTGASIAFEVSDFDAAVAELRKAGTPFVMEPLETPVCRMALISDPDGSALFIHQRKG